MDKKTSMKHKKFTSVGWVCWYFCEQNTEGKHDFWSDNEIWMDYLILIMLNNYLYFLNDNSLDTETMPNQFEFK